MVAGSLLNDSLSLSLSLSLALSLSLSLSPQVWVCVEGQEMQRKDVELCWACRSVGYYHDLPCHGAAFSEDGSLLAVNFGKVFHLFLSRVLTCQVKSPFLSSSSSPLAVLDGVGSLHL